MLTEEQLQDMFEIADLLSNGDRELFLKLKQVVFASNPDEILDYIESILDALAFDDFLDKIGDSEKDNLWLIMLTLLEHHGYVCLRNRTDRLRDFVHFFDRLEQVRSVGLSLALDPTGLDAAASLPAWAAVIDSRMEQEGYCLGSIESSSDNYILFFSTRSIYERVQELAAGLGYSIRLAQHV